MLGAQAEDCTTIDFLCNEITAQRFVSTLRKPNNSTDKFRLAINAPASSTERMRAFAAQLCVFNVAAGNCLA